MAAFEIVEVLFRTVSELPIGGVIVAIITK
jgi:hypothetical protein